MANILTNKITPDFRWNEAAQRYIGPGSKGFVKNTTVREAIDKYIDKKGVEAQELAEALRDNLISIEEFQESLRELITDVHLANAAAAKGGWAQLTQSDYGKVGQMVKQELAGLKKWGKDGKKGGGFRKLLEDIESGKIPLDGRFVNRVKMYAQAGRHTYESMRRDEMVEAGMTEARSIRHASDSCNGCLNQALAGWMSLDDLILPGERDCVRNCKCTVEYRKANPDQRINTLVKKVQNGGTLTENEIQELTDGVANSGFPAAPQRVTKNSGLEGVVWDGRKLKLGDRIPSDYAHYLKHVVVQKEWPPGTTFDDYMRHVKEVVTDPKSGILISKVGRNTQISFVRKSGDAKGPNGNKWVLVDYRLRLHSVMTSFQPEKGINHTRRGRQNRKWIRERQK